MFNQIPFTLRRASLIPGALLLSSIFASSAFAFGNGSILSNQNCSDCHGVDVATLMITGPDQILPGTASTFTLSITDGPAVVGGFNIFADGGLFAAGSGMQETSGELTHTEPKAFSAGSVSWNFEWLAPTVDGIYSIFAQGVSANGAQGSNGDATGTAFHEVVVAQIPIPAAAILFGSGLGFLGWFRRRVTKS